MTRASNADRHRETGAAGRGDPVPRRTQDLELVETAGSLRHSAPRHDRGSWSLWLWVAAGFLFLAILWTGMFIAARHADTRTVPLATKEARP